MMDTICCDETSSLSFMQTKRQLPPILIVEWLVVNDFNQVSLVDIRNDCVFAIWCYDLEHSATKWS